MDILELKKNIALTLSVKPELLNDINFVLTNLAFMNKPLSAFSEEFQKNDLFITQYFSTHHVDSKDYVLIPEHLLQNPVFISLSLKHNPDLYFLTEPIFHTESFYNEIKLYHPKIILKYASDEQLNNYDYCLHHVKEHPENYPFVEKNMLSNFQIIQAAFNLSKFPFSKTKGDNEYQEERLKSLFKHVPNSFKNDLHIVKQLVLNSNIELFPYISKKLYNDKDLCTRAVLRRSYLFKYVADELKNDIVWIQSLLNSGMTQNNHTSSYLSSIQNHENLFDLTDILNGLSIDLFSEDFCKVNSTIIANSYPKLNKNLRSREKIMLTAFSHPTLNQFQKVYNSNISNQVYTDNRLLYMNTIPNEDIKKSLKLYYKNNYKLFNSNINQNSEIIVRAMQQIIKTIPYYNKLNNEITNNNTTSKRMKI